MTSSSTTTTKKKSNKNRPPSPHSPARATWPPTAAAANASPPLRIRPCERSTRRYYACNNPLRASRSAAPAAIATTLTSCPSSPSLTATWPRQPPRASILSSSSPLRWRNPFLPSVVAASDDKDEEVGAEAEERRSGAALARAGKRRMIGEERAESGRWKGLGGKGWTGWANANAPSQQPPTTTTTIIIIIIRRLREAAKLSST